VKRVALTGGIATGKSHVRQLFERFGVPTIDADTAARDVVAPGTPGLAAIVARFGPGVLDGSGALDRRALAQVVFADQSARRDLEAIVHPPVAAATDAWLGSLDAARCPLAVADIPLLYETGRDRDFDAVVVTACDPDTQLRRVMARDGIGEVEARQRIAAQLPTEDKAARADYVIRTDGSYEDTERHVRAVLTALSNAGTA
jgi:dephospho-CoA kinase